MTPAELRRFAEANDAYLRDNGERRVTPHAVDREAGVMRCEAVDADGKRWGVVAMLPEGAT